jgi:hypothetical protein
MLHELRELFSAGLLGAATVASAWCAYQAALWNGEQTRSLVQASTAYFQSLQSTSEWHVLTSIDVSTFLSYLHEDLRGEGKLAEYIRGHARPEFRPALDDWIAERQAGREPGDLPFNSSHYRLGAAVAAGDLNNQANAATIAANKATEYADLFVLHTVMFAVALFFLGTASVAHVRAVGLAMSVLGTLAVILSALSMARLPRAPSAPGRSDLKKARSDH